MKLFRKVCALSLVVVMAAGLIACSGGSTGSEDTDSQVSQDSTGASDEGGTLIMATNATFPPYEYVEGSDYQGIDVEIAGEIAKKLGKELKIEDVEFDTIIGGVQSGKYDMGMAGMTVTEERKQSVSFSDTYATGVQSVIVMEDSDIKTVDDITKDNKIGVQQGTTGDIYASEDYEGATTAYKSGAEAVQALSAGKVDCVIIDNEPAKEYVKANEGMKILDTAYAQEDYAICISKDNEELLSEINNALGELKDDGTIDSIVARYITADGE